MAYQTNQVVLQPEDRELLIQWVNAHSTPQQVVLRSHIILLSDQHLADLQIAQQH